MSFQIIYSQGSASVTVPATESIVVSSEGTAKVYKIVGYPNRPDQRDLVGTVTEGQTVFGAYSSETVIEIEAGAAGASYSVGVAPTISDDGKYQFQKVPLALNATGALTATMLLNGIVTSTTAAAVAGTVPTGTVLDAADEFAISDSFDFSVIATGGNAFTVTAATGITIVGSAVVATVTSGAFRVRKTAANTFVIYRLGQYNQGDSFGGLPFFKG